MKITLLISGVILLNIFYAQDQKADKWRNDLDYLVQRIEIMHPNPYAYCPKEVFYKLKEKLYNEISKLSDVDISISISELLASLKDGHTRWAFEKSDPNWLIDNFHLLPIISYPFADGTYILAGLQQYKEYVGKKIIKIGKMDIAEVESKLGKIWSHDNKSGEIKYLYYTLCVAEMLKKIGAIDDINKIELMLSDENNVEIKTQITTEPFMNIARYIADTWYPKSGNGLVTINESTHNPLPLWLKNLNKSFWYEYLPEYNLMYLQINSLNFPSNSTSSMESFNQLCSNFFEALDRNTVEKLVIDIRANNGGNHVESPLLKGIIARPYIDQKGKLFIITGRVTYSAAVHFTTVFKKFTNATIIGEPSSGRPNHYGAVRSFKLPNHPYIEIDCSIDYYQDSVPFDFNISNTPEIEIKTTSADYKNNIDRSMESVTNYKNIIDLIESLFTELEPKYIKEGLSGFKEHYYSKKKILLNSNYNQEIFLTNFYNKVVIKDKKNMPDRIEYLNFATAECPESIDLCYSLGVQLELQGNYDDAKKWYNHCLKLNPAHHYAKMKLGLIKLNKRDG